MRPAIFVVVLNRATDPVAQTIPQVYSVLRPFLTHPCDMIPR